jgi:phosphoglycerate dehydrogenase-like enzyme
LDGVDVVIPLMARIDATVLEHGRFGLIQQFGVGLETVDIDAATRAGVWVARVPSPACANAASVAEHAILLMLALSRRLPELPQAVKTHHWGAPTGIALQGKTACIIGLGGIGQALAKRLSVFGMRLLGVHDHPVADVPADLGLERVFAMADLPAAMREADFLVLCINYKARLHFVFNQALLAHAKPGAFLINVARGGLVDPEALLDALTTHRLAGAGLDVFWEEPVNPDHALFRQNVIATPHIAGVTDASYSTIALVCVENIVRYARGEKPEFTVNVPSPKAQGRHVTGL